MRATVQEDVSHSSVEWVCVYRLVIRDFPESIKTSADQVWSVLGVGRGSEKYKVWEENKQSLQAMGNLLPLSSQRNEMSMGR